MRTNIRRSAAAILAGALALSVFSLTPAAATSKHQQIQPTVTTTMSARRHHGNAAILGAVGGLFGTIAALAAADAARDDYYGYYGYPYYAPRYGYAYAPRYRYHRWHHWHHRHHR
ncbi:MAG TPA: hypothetical protein VFS63_04120 [Pseudolabrys sp.]|nr:hypothetical protein [Pseudolabrys sp.]